MADEIWDDRNDARYMRHVRVLFAADGTMSVDRAYSHADAQIVDLKNFRGYGSGCFVGPADVTLFVIDASDNAKHLIGRHEARRPLAPPTDGKPGFIEGVLRRDVA